jgi:hypothetical protein
MKTNKAPLTIHSVENEVVNIVFNVQTVRTCLQILNPIQGDRTR